MDESEATDTNTLTDTSGGGGGSGHDDLENMGSRSVRPKIRYDGGKRARRMRATAALALVAAQTANAQIDGSGTAAPGTTLQQYRTTKQLLHDAHLQVNADRVLAQKEVGAVLSLRSAQFVVCLSPCQHILRGCAEFLAGFLVRRDVLCASVILRLSRNLFS